MSAATIRCKFRVSSVEHFDSVEPTGRVKMYPVYKGKQISEREWVNAENAVFGKATPSGEFTATIMNPEAFQQFKPGQEWYIDLTLAE